jgi:ABC-type enterochelin transport system permease subunit
MAFLTLTKRMKFVDALMSRPMLHLQLLHIYNNKCRFFQVKLNKIQKLFQIWKSYDDNIVFEKT